MLDFLRHLLNGQNQFASGGLLLMILGSIGVFLRSLPRRLGHWLVDQCTMNVSVKDDDRAFTWVKEWFLEQDCLKRIRSLDVDTTLRGDEVALIPAPGRHWFFRKGRLFWVSLSRGEETRGWNPRRMEMLSFHTVGRDQNIVRSFIDEVAACHHARRRLISHLYLFDDGWNQVEAYSPRLLESVLLKPGEKEHIVQDIERFRAARPRYGSLGVPYHRGYLLYGPPGTGKSSLASALGARFGMSIYAVNLAEMNDRSLKGAMNSVPKGSIILFEDLDCMRSGKRPIEANGWTPEQLASPDAVANLRAPDRAGVSLSGLLNVLDGFQAPENVIFIMTTNDIDALDAALLRPGRIDYRLFLGEAAESQKLDLYRRFFPEAGDAEAREFAQAHSAETMAEFQGLLLSLDQECCILEPEGACKA